VSPLQRAPQPSGLNPGHGRSFSTKERTQKITEANRGNPRATTWCTIKYRRVLQGGHADCILDPWRPRDPIEPWRSICPMDPEGWRGRWSHTPLGPSATLGHRRRPIYRPQCHRPEGTQGPEGSGVLWSTTVLAARTLVDPPLLKAKSALVS